MMQSIHVIDVSFTRFGFVRAASNLCYCQKIMRVGIVPNKAIKIRTLSVLDSQ
jgi:hypothetical protein